MKAKAKELYGDIKDGDRFDLRAIGYGSNLAISLDSDQKWRYNKIIDELTLQSFPLYKQGKWAKKVEGPVMVNVSSIRYSREPIIEYIGELIHSETIDCTVHFTIVGSSPKIILKEDFRQLLSKCLEDYLNKS